MTTTVQLTPEAIASLRQRLEREGYAFRSLQHAHYQARGEGVTVNAYRSGKVVIQGKAEQAFLEAHGLAQPAAPVSDETVAGSDESGKGDYFGPLVVAAVVAGPAQAEELSRLGVQDSKRMSDASALRAAAAVRRLCAHAVRSLSPAEYGARHEKERNVALFLASMHAEALAEAIAAVAGCDRVVVDQFTHPGRLEAALAARGIDLPLEIRPRAEDNPAVAAASVLARAEFLIGLRELGNEQGLELPKGAGEAVDAVGRQIYRAGGRDALASVAKLHFKNTTRITKGD
jgi:ribonuclease HIII